MNIFVVTQDFLKFSDWYKNNFAITKATVTVSNKTNFTSRAKVSLSPQVGVILRQLDNPNPSPQSAIVHASNNPPAVLLCVIDLHCLEIGCAIKSPNCHKLTVDYSQTHLRRREIFINIKYLFLKLLLKQFCFKKNIGINEINLPSIFVLMCYNICCNCRRLATLKQILVLK